MVSARTLAARPDPSGTAALAAAGVTDPGVQRDVNEDRFHCDTRRGVFVVIDGVGGQAAGGRAADVALSALRARLDRQDGADSERVRDAITTANNEIYRLASTRPEWDGMACVLTVAVVRDNTATYGHVGDTRLYKLRGNTITKLTRDHSPVGEREDANEISERQAMLHPRRNEVYRDVGSEPHGPSDPNFVDVAEVPFEPDAALLLCSDGLTDLVDSTSIVRMVREFAGDPEAVVHALIRAANAAGGKDNVTAVYVEGERFAGVHDGRPPVVRHPVAAGRVGTRTDAHSKRRRRVVLAIVALLLAGAVGAWFRTTDWTLPDLRTLGRVGAPVPVVTRRIVAPSESIAAALRDAAPGSEIVVEPGEYREQLTLAPGVRLLSRVPRGATIRLPAAIPDGAPVAAVMAKGVNDAVVEGFRISGDAATPLPVGIFLEGSTVSIVNVEITGATRAAVELSGEGAPVLMASDIHDNPGAAVIARDRTAARVTHNAFARNGTSGRGSAPLVVDGGAQPAFIRNVFIGSNPASVSTLTGAAQADLRRDNWFVPSARR